MNKKQAIVAWVMIVSIGIVIAKTIIAIPSRGSLSIMKFYLSLGFIIIIGALFIYGLRGKQSKA